LQHRRVKMPQISFNELANAAHLHITNFATGTVTFDAKLTARWSSVNCIF